MFTCPFRSTKEAFIPVYRDAWLAHAERRGLTPETIGHVMTQWREGHISLLVDEKDFSDSYQKHIAEGR